MAALLNRALLSCLIALWACEAAESASVEADAEPDSGRVLIDASGPDAGPDAAPDAAPARDGDGDGVPDSEDAFPEDPSESADRDGDGVGDNADAFPRDPEEQTDGDGDGVGDNGDPFPEDPSEWSDRDGDGTGDNTDPFPNDPTEWADVDNDGLGNNEDPDDDNDGLSDLEEELPGEDCVVSAPRRADTDGDGIADGVDLYPNDPFPEFMLRRADRRIELYLSNRDGSFGEAVLIGEEIEHEGRPLQYQGFAVGDFDGNGVMDFLASTSPLVEGEPTHRVYHFVRDTKADEFIQIDLGLTDIRLGGIIVDADADLRFDLAWFEQERAGNVAGGRLWVHLNNYPPLDQCVAGGPEDGCFFIRQPALDLTGTVGGQWIARMALQAVNLDPEAGDTPDLTLTTYASGGNAPTRVYSLAGNGDGTFQPPVERFVHNGDRRLAPANTVMFADFNVDGVGDVLLGFDDDGRPGEAWTYFGIGDGTFFEEPAMALDINPGDAREMGGGENLGREGSGRTFDFDFDGHPDLIIGVHHVAYDAPGQTRLYRGNGDGTFAHEFVLIGEDSLASGAIAIPQRLCPNFRFELPVD